MATLVPRGNPDSRPLEVADDQVEFWTERGYVVQKSSGSTAKKSATKKSSSRKSS